MSSSRLVPRDISEFRKKSYWDKFFTEREKSFEWYGDWSEIRDVVPRYCEGEILISGCGNSALSEKMYVVCFKSSLCIGLTITFEIFLKYYQSVTQNAGTIWSSTV